MGRTQTRPRTIPEACVCVLWNGPGTAVFFIVQHARIHVLDTSVFHAVWRPSARPVARCKGSCGMGYMSGRFAVALDGMMTGPG